MLKVRPSYIFCLNILLILVSWIFYRSPRGDEYLTLFMIPLVFIAVPFVMNLTQTLILLSCNLIFFTLYRFLGVLDMVDIFILMLLLGVVAGGGYLASTLYKSFALYYKSDFSKRQRKYNSIVTDLESIDRRGRKTENELTRISRLYELTKKLASVLKMEELLDALFDFFEENYKFQATHLLTFSKGKFLRGISKGLGGKDYSDDKEKALDYEKVLDCAQEKNFEPFFIERNEAKELFNSLKVQSDTFMVFPLFVGDRLSAMLAIEGASKTNYGRFRILIPQIALELRKVELYEQIQKLSIIDGLTEVYLRRYLEDRLEEEVDRAQRLKLTFSIGMVDVDNFKKCNDTYGHLVGDAVLNKIAKSLTNSVREVDMVARFGGEEFCIVLPETTKELALTVAERLRESIEHERIKAFDEEIRATVSVGIATYPKDGKDVTALIEKADMALYKAKRKGRNVVCVA